MTEHNHPTAHADHDHDHDHEPGHSHERVTDAAAQAQAMAAAQAQARQGTLQQSRLRIEAMDCPTEQNLLESKLQGMPGVQKLEFNLINRELLVSHSLASTAPIEQAISALGMHAELVTDSRAAARSTPPEPERKAWWPLLLAAVAAVGSEVVEFTQLGPQWLSAAFAVLAVALCGFNTYKKGWIALKNLNLNINALMSIAVTGALLIGQWPEAAMVMVLFTIAELIEARSLDRARNAIRGLLDMAPQRATRQQADGSWQEVDVQAVAVGDVLRVRPGERIALDGEVRSGHSTVDQAPITGESLPVEKAPGDALFAGTINQAGAMEYQVKALAGDSTLARIIHAVEEAQGSRAPTQRFVDQFARIYTPVVFVLALLVALLPPLLLGGAWFDWVYRALVLLVVACPCALVISTPVTIVSGLAAAARKGILIKGGVYLENGRHITALALDKTGTITHGKPVQTDSLSLLAEAQPEHALWAASLAARSDHPVSKALAVHAEQAGQKLLAVDDFSALLGRGTQGSINGTQLYLGNHRLVEELGICSPDLESQLQALEQQGKSVVVLCDSSRPLMLFAVADTVRQSSREAIAELQQLGVRSTMLTGDNRHTAAAIASQVGVDEARGDLLPADKLAWVSAQQEQGQVVAMVGDGINDAPALAKAQIGFAMGAAGTDTAIETADVALMDDDLRKIPVFIRLSRQTARVLKQNIVLALGIKALFLLLTMIGDTSMWMAVFADMGVSLLVVFNGLRLLRQ
ncbi:heavy metal translocating P-type ATPase [Pseudomonas sp. 5P_3.1_Bac2]|uniref:heavy metal translocating P-type ATPase n=1 Tax=Pseudomonas sp. 5P_3.1_Bac2 TaxID=2971617 RepID=UPI0021C79E91|nr:heavy metal translocating P-type ATPase [Pseudomonas sp. 5P_3.1_Bac2]MCU1717374.1 heavy metal translocating P-type ATPase [Pseudomonas sp. 5P_3.1_Bac2]